jgi:signal transduction histidine kinase
MAISNPGKLIITRKNPPPLLAFKLLGQREEENGKLVFFVRDNGMGIAPEHHDRIFGLLTNWTQTWTAPVLGLPL